MGHRRCKVARPRRPSRGRTGRAAGQPTLSRAPTNGWLVAASTMRQPHPDGSTQLAVRTSAAGAAAPRYSSRQRRGTAATAAAARSAGAANRLLGPVEVHRIVHVTHRVELVGAHAEAGRRRRSARRRQVADPDRRKGRIGHREHRAEEGRDPRRAAVDAGQGPVDRQPGGQGAVGGRERRVAAGDHLPRRDRLGDADQLGPVRDRAGELAAPRRGRARRARVRDTSPARSRAPPSGTRPGPRRSGAAPTSGSRRPGRPRRTAPGSAVSRGDQARPHRRRAAARRSIRHRVSRPGSVRQAGRASRG